MAMRKVLLLNGPNLDMLGMREPEVYGNGTLEALEHVVRSYAGEHGIELSCFQSNSEGDLIGQIHGAQRDYDGIVYNPGAHTHYSYALRDAVAAIDVPVVEVHISDVDSREPFRRVSVIAPACVAQVKGLGVEGYCRAVDILLENDGLHRLGEGYGSRFESGANIRIARWEAACEEGGDGFSGGDGLVGEGKPANGEGLADGNESSDGEQHVAMQPTAFASGSDMGAVAQRRQAAVRAACAKTGLDALLVRDTSNIRWLTGFDGVFDEERAHALLIGEGGAVLHTDSRYSNAMVSAAKAIGSNVRVEETRIGHFEFARKELSAGADDAFEGKLGFEDSITYAEFVRAVGAFTTANLAPTSNAVLSMRAVKDGSEIERLRTAQAITDAAFRHIVEFMRPGMAEREVQLELESFMLRHGADGLAFGSIVACGENGADPHAVPSAKKLEAGQCVVMDFGARAYGYCSDMTRMVFLGEPQGTMARAWEVLRQANEAVESMLRPGVTGVEAHNLAEQVLEEGGFGGRMGHGLGHGVGLDCHELPVLNTRNDAPLVEGNVVTVEPGIYLPGEFGMRLEDCGVITADGYDVFSQIGHETVVI